MCALSLKIRSIISYSNSAMRLEVGKKDGISLLILFIGDDTRIVGTRKS